MNAYLIKKYSLTKRESDILKNLVKGYTNPEIAKILNISTHTVKAYVGLLLNKFGASTRVGLAVFAVKESILNDFEVE